MSQAHDKNSRSGNDNPVEYWRSLRHRKMDPAYREMLEREFPEGITEKPLNLNRRSFLTLMGASLALAGLASCRRPEEKIVPYVSRPEGVIPGTVQKYATSMPFGTEFFTLLVHSREGRPVHVSGNDANPLTGRSSNVWANASILDLYDPDRSQFVLNNGAESSVAAFADAWKALAEKHAVDKGTGLAVLSGSFASPTLHRLRREFLDRYPSARWIAYEPVDDENIRRGMETAFGRNVQPVYDFSRADVILAIDADFLGTESRSLANARSFAGRRHVVKETDGMNRLYVVESSLTQTTTMADHRLVMPASRMFDFLLAVAGELRGMGLSIPAESVTPNIPETGKKWVEAVASDLVRAGKSALVLAGRKQPPHVHALAAAINQALGNTGSTVTYKAPPFTLASDSGEFVSLVRDMKAGAVKTLVVLNTNPVYAAPADLDVRAAMEAVETVIQLSSHVDETSPFAAWHVPRHHYLESWGDVGGMDECIGVIQPLIAPLYQGMSVVELAGLLATGSMQKGYDLVRETWKSFLPPSSFEKKWEKVLHDGLLRHEVRKEMVQLDAAAVRSLLADTKPKVPSLSPRNLEIVFQPSLAVFDGRFANNGWLQEFPDPVTKLTWDNAAVMSPGTAEALGLENNDLVRLSYGGREIALPVWIMPGQADFSIGVTLGYGRQFAGRIGSNVGGNAYRLRTYAKPFIDTGLKLSSSLGKHELACVQDHHGLDTEKIAREGIRRRLPQLIREATLDEYRRKPDFVDEIAETPDLQSMWDDHVYDEGNQWGMAIDLNACIGCGACTIACQSENNVPIVGREQVLNGREMHWIRVDRYFHGEVENPAVRVQPVGCMQCEMAPCEQVCPVGATSHDEEGLNTMAYNRCIGTRYCSNNCPYKVRRFNFFNYTKDLPEIVQMAQNPDVTVRFRGVMEKCTYCVQRIQREKIAAKREDRELRDGDIRTACEETCPTRAIVFGNILDPNSRVTQWKRRSRDYALLGEFNLRPRTTYLARLTNPNPELTGKGNET